MTNIEKMKDDALIALYVDGNDKAFDIVLERYQQRLFSYIYFLVKDQEIAEDIFQDTFIKAIVFTAIVPFSASSGVHSSDL